MLHTLWPHRTIEAIKAKRKSADYKKLLQSLMSQSTIVAAREAVSLPPEDLHRPSVVDNRPAMLALRDAVLESRGALSIRDERLDRFLDACVRSEKDNSTQSFIDEEIGLWAPPVEVNHRGGRNFPTQVDDLANASRRKARRIQYRRVQRLYRISRGKCAEEVLSGNWELPKARCPDEELVEFWKPLFEEPSQQDDRRFDPINGIKDEVAKPITMVEVENAIRLSKSSGAPGPDGLKLSHVRALGSKELACHFNLWLLAGGPPSRLRKGRTTLIPKKAEAKEPGDFRPITVTSSLIRLFHKILACRLEACLPISFRQKAFRSGDGIAANVFLLQSIINDRKHHLKPLAMAFVDVAKAFDSVSQQSIIIALQRVGVPSVILEYIAESYRSASTILCDKPVRLNRGVKQGDPLSPVLFNSVIDMALSELDPSIGIQIGNSKVNHMAFADDVVLLAETGDGLRALAERYEEALAKSGLRLNGRKSATLRIVIDAKKKRWVCDPLPLLTLGGVGVPGMSATSVYKYLGISAAATRKETSITTTLSDALLHLKRAPLKPQQRLYLLRTYLIPKFHHVLSLEEVSAGRLKRIDIKIREAVRAWLRLPKDTLRSFFEAPVRDGGLGITCLQHTVPILRKTRFDNFAALSQTDPFMQEVLVSSTSFLAARNRAERSLRAYGLPYASTDTLKQVQRGALYSGVDGIGLSHSSLSPRVHDWVTSGCA